MSAKQHSLFAATSLLLYVCLASGSYIVEVNVHNYQNPSGRCEDCQEGNDPGPGCCDEEGVRPLTESCPVVCDTLIAYCSLPLGNVNITCDPGADGNSSRFFTYDSNSIDFDAEGTLLGTDLPLIIEGDEPWNGLQFVLQSRDCAILVAPCVLHLSIDQVLIDIDIPVGTSSPEQAFEGDARIAYFNVSYSVRCAADYYGEDCTSECTNFVSCEECGLPGLTGVFCQFPADICSVVYCNDNGECEDGSPTCDCVLGFEGDSCEVDINECEGVNCSSNGRCDDRVNSFSCVCEPGFTGSLCELLIPTMPTYTTTSSSSEDQESGLDVAALTGGVVGAIVFVVLIAIIVVLAVIIFLQRKQNSKPTDQEKTEMTRNQLQGVRTTDGNIKMEPVYDTPVKKIKMTQNQLHGVRTTGEDTKMENMYDTPEEKMEMTQNQLYGMRRV